MKLESYGILIGLRPFGERDSVAHIFTADYGVLTGMLRGSAVAKKNRPLVGQTGTVAWSARLDSQLGVFHWESDRNMAASLMTDARKLGVMNAAFALIDALLPERECYAQLFEDTRRLLSDLAAPGDASAAYLEWETKLLGELGYALDLSHCSGCGARENLNFLSPRTGRAVCDTCAAPYVNRLYKLPVTLAVTARFLDMICEQQGGRLPMARVMLMR